MAAVATTKISNVLHGSKPTLIMLLVQTILGFVNIGYKLAANDGMRLPVLVAYRFMFGAAFIIPIAFFVERKKRPKMTMKIAFQGFLCGLFGGALGQNLYLKALDLTSATFISAMTNLVPALTFIIAVILRLERVGWNSGAGKAKIFGTILGIGGAILLTLYKGPELNLWNTHLNLLETTRTHPLPQGTQPHPQSSGDFVLGAVLAVLSCVCYALWLIIQAKCAAIFPCPYSITGMMSFWAAVQGTLYAVCTEKDWSNWIMGWDIRLLVAAVAGIVGNGVTFTLVAWCVRMRGPLFVSIFQPLLLVVVAIVGSLLIAEKLHLGLVLGAILIVAGLYIVLWGTGKEAKKVSQLMPENQVQTETPAAAAAQSGGGSSHGGSKEEEEREDDRRDSQSSDVLSAIYILP